MQFLNFTGLSSFISFILLQNLTVSKFSVIYLLFNRKRIHLIVKKYLIGRIVLQQLSFHFLFPSYYVFIILKSFLETSRANVLCNYEILCFLFYYKKLLDLFLLSFCVNIGKRIILRTLIFPLEGSTCFIHNLHALFRLRFVQFHFYINIYVAFIYFLLFPRKRI